MAGRYIPPHMRAAARAATAAAAAAAAPTIRKPHFIGNKTGSTNVTHIFNYTNNIATRRAPAHHSATPRKSSLRAAAAAATRRVSPEGAPPHPPSHKPWKAATTFWKSVRSRTGMKDPRKSKKSKKARARHAAHKKKKTHRRHKKH